MALNAEMTIALACMRSTHCKSSTMARSTITKANATQYVLRPAAYPPSRDRNVAVRDDRRTGRHDSVVAEFRSARSGQSGWRQSTQRMARVTIGLMDDEPPCLV